MDLQEPIDALSVRAEGLAGGARHQRIAGRVSAAWIAATAGVLVTVFWINAPRWVTASCYLVAGWIAVMVLPRLWNGLGPARFSLLAAGAALYTLGAVVYARKRPDPAPETFGYHEVFHALVIAAATCHYVLITSLVRP